MEKIIDIKDLLDSGKVSEVYCIAREDVYGYFQLRPDSIKLEHLMIVNKNWDEIDGWHIEGSKFNPNEKVFRGNFICSNELEVDLNWLTSEINDFLNSEWGNQSWKGEYKEADIWDFIDYGMEESNFEFNTESVLIFESKEDSNKSISRTYETEIGLNDIIAGIITEGHGTNYSFRFKLKDSSEPLK